MRLIGNPTETATVEAYDGYNWGRVCEFVDIEDVMVVCRHLGYKTALAAVSVPNEGKIIRPKIFGIRECWRRNKKGAILRCSTEINPTCLCSKYDAGVICSEGKNSERVKRVRIW